MSMPCVIPPDVSACIRSSAVGAATASVARSRGSGRTIMRQGKSMPSEAANSVLLGNLVLGPRPQRGSIDLLRLVAQPAAGAFILQKAQQQEKNFPRRVASAGAGV